MENFFVVPFKDQGLQKKKGNGQASIPLLSL
jgi:hypothetical protein